MTAGLDHIKRNGHANAKLESLFAPLEE